MTQVNGAERPPNEQLENGRTRVHLLYPVKHGEKEVAHLDIRRPKARDLRDFPAQGATMGHVLGLLVRVTGATASVIDELDAEDLEAAGQVLEGPVTAFPTPGGGR